MIDDVEEQTKILERHLEILQLVYDREPIGIVKMSNETNHAHHEVRYSLRALEEEDLIEPSPQGARTTDQTDSFLTDLDEQIDNLRERLSVADFSSETATASQ